MKTSTTTTLVLILTLFDISTIAMATTNTNADQPIDMTKQEATLPMEASSSTRAPNLLEKVQTFFKDVLHN